MAIVNVCPAGHDQSPTKNGAGVVVSAPSENRPGRCHRCGAPLTQFETEAA